jgi:hypothetical protein
MYKTPFLAVVELVSPFQGAFLVQKKTDLHGHATVLCKPVLASNNIWLT